MLAAVLLALPWLLLGLYLALFLHLPRPLPDPRRGGLRRPPVSVIVPARNEARNILPCLESLTSLAYPDFEVIVVDDRSEDETARIAASVPRGSAWRLTVVAGGPLPEGWFGKPWACWQGAQGARGELLLFTDADTRHDSSLLDRAVEALREDGADAVSVVGRQSLESFWERVVQPQFFYLLALRYRDLRRPLTGRDHRNAIANGQFILISRDAYDGVGGHRAVRAEVVEDLQLAKAITASGYVLSVREGDGALATRMYTSLREVMDGWTKNIWVGARQSAGPRLGRLAVPGILLQVFCLWILPPLALLAGMAGLGSVPLLLWAGISTACGLSVWVAMSLRLGVSPFYGLAFPLGAAVACLVVIRSWRRGRRIEWKGRWYGPEGSRSGRGL